jgi:hypothetical protein
VANPTREDTWTVTLNLDGVDEGIWDKKEGGEADSEELKYPPGGMEDEISMGGRKTYGNVTISRYCDISRDWPKVPGWLAKAGACRGTIGQQPMDIHKNPQGPPLVMSGTLKTVTPPEPDSTGNSEARIEMEFTIDTVS